jgi:ATP-binding cassette subfamily C (CFTR/MRP) protein 4
MKENILFGLPYDSERYNAVIEACALDKDIESLPNGDLTIVGERGVTLSGGQKARVNLARAIYHEADVYLLDDPLSAVDAAVSRHIFDKCICGLLSEKCVILVTHQIQYLNQCDIILQLHEGSIGVYGEPKYVLQKNKSLFNLLKSNDSNSIEPLHHSGSQVNLDDVNKTGLSFSIDITKNSDKSLGNEEHGSNIDETTFTVGLSEEENAHGRITLKTYCQYFIAGGGYIFTGIVMLIFILTEINMVLSDWWMSDW